MTTSVTVKTHDWPVEIVEVWRDAPTTTQTVSPNSEQVVAVHSQLTLHIKELPIPEEKK